jgi:hypothetical protein
LDRCYLEKTSNVVQGALLIDFLTFFVESGLLFAAAWSVRSGISTFMFLGLLLCVDMLWGVVSHHIHFPKLKSHALTWSTINVIAMFFAILVVAYPFQAKPVVLMVIALLRFVADYWFSWTFYFPSAQNASQAAAAAK